MVAPTVAAAAAEQRATSFLEYRQPVVIVLVAVSLSLVATGNGNVLWECMFSTWDLLLRILGTTVGVGLGLGLATHIHDRLEVWHARHEATTEEEEEPRRTPKKLRSIRANSAEEETSYASLMSSAGYDVSDRVHRCQVVRRSSDFLNPYYRFTSIPPDQQRGPQIMAQQWPHLPHEVSFQLGCFIEYIVRDFIASWYSIIDGGCPYENEKEKRKAQQEQNIQEQETSSNAPSTLSDRVMVWSTVGRRPLPMLHTMYHSLAIIFGNLSCRVEHVNVFSLILIKWFKVLGRSFKVYRQLRRLALTKTAGLSSSSLQHQRKPPRRKKRLDRAQSAPLGNSKNQNMMAASAVGINAELIRSSSQHTEEPNADSDDGSFDVRLEYVEEEEQVPPTLGVDSEHNTESSNPKGELPHVSEMAMTKEYLLAGKLHHAVTFGLDVPSLLFADTSGKECGVGSNEFTEENLSEEQVLEKRLFETTALQECEMDYNRVLANRFCRALLPRSEFSSPIIRTLGTEMIAGCVLSPIMGCFAPDYINDWICQGIDSMAMEKDGDEHDDATDDADDALSDLADERDVNMKKGIDLSCKDTAVENVKDTNGVNVVSDCVGTGSAEEDHMLDNENDVTDEEMDDVDDATEEDDDDDDEKVASDPSEETDTPLPSPRKSAPSTGDDILPLLTMALIELQHHMDFEDCREARLRQEQVAIDWDTPSCREAVRQLVLVIEGALLHGCRGSRKRTLIKKPKSGPLRMNDAEDIAPDELAENDYMESFDSEIDTHGEAVEVSLPRHQSSSLSQVLMELTSDIEAFAARVAEEESMRQDIEEEPLSETDDGLDSVNGVGHKPSQTEVSTLRTLIAAWLHTGQIYHIISVISRAYTSVLEPFYHKNGFLRNSNHARDFCRQLKSLDGVDILVDTTAVLASSSLDFNKSGSTVMELEGKIQDTWQRDTPSSLATDNGGGPATHLSMPKRSGLAGSVKRMVIRDEVENTTSPSDAGSQTGELPGVGSATAAALSQRYFGSSTPRYLDFHRNEAFASSLRLERERRMKSWADVTAAREGETPGIIWRTKGVTPRDKVIHRELHNIARILYAGTNMLAIRSGPRRKHSEESVGQASIDSNAQTEAANVSLLTVETACQRRRIEVPDDDSSFLLRAQPRPLNPVGVHRDPRNSEHSFKSYHATYEEPAILPGDTRYRGGRYIRRCLLRYYPIDRTASIALPQDSRQLDHRNNWSTNDEDSAVEGPSTPFLSTDFLAERHLCKKWHQKGAPRSGSILTSSVMEPSDFCATPRTGRALDFVYRMALFERPMVELGGKRFTVHDSTSAGVHRADASSLELSDASLSVALLIAGNDWNEGDLKEEEEYDEKPSLSQVSSGIQWQTDQSSRPRVQMGPDGYPIVWMKLNTKQGDKSNVEVKPCRTSYVRASLLIASTRQNAQLRCLLKCVSAGSARSATKARTDALLWPTLKLLEFSNGPMKEKQSVLLRDLKLGINHIDREQLRRNGLLHPRSPTSILSLMAAIEGALQAKDTGVELQGVAPNTIVFRIRCVAVVDLADLDDDDSVELQYLSEDGSNSGLFREEWIVYRSFREFSQLHKHLKSQVAVTETSVSAGARLVGAATAAFTVHGSSTGSQRIRKAMVPSLGQAKAGALGATRKMIQKRRSVLGSYLKHLTSPTHLLNRCPELLLFLGAFYPLPSEVRTGGGILRQVRDSLARTHMARTMLSPLSTNNVPADSDHVVEHSVSVGDTPKKNGESGVLDGSTRTEKSEQSTVTASSISHSEHNAAASSDKVERREEGTRQRRRSRKIVMKPSIKAKIDQVTLGEVRLTTFELVRHLFDFDNASFFRSRMFSAMKTMSFAVTTGSEFRKMLYEAHIKQLNPEALSGWIRFLLDTLWPDGVFFDSKPPLTPEESKALADKAKQKLPTACPDQIRQLLGAEITENGFEILHEMLQNRLVLKSMAYMLFDLVWLEIFPELQDILTCGSALDVK